ncbi:MAG: type III-B CRISPR module RAMP protein Cmr1 [Candidatus Bathyarchaeota archaeon]|nr:type III-B CRISPR module RAMP protein Cmr1 [Candidatus Bathyarchaeota archaeon]
MIEVKLRTLTPLWTGNVDRKSLSLREVGIIGSLRWWYETLLRAYGKDACDPTDSLCNAEKHCNACELFGCTGWSRKFRLEIFSDAKLKSLQQLRMRTMRGQRRFLNLYVSGLSGEFSIKIITLRTMKINEETCFWRALQIINEYAALGAKTAQGNGVVQIEGLEPIKTKELPLRSKFAKNNASVLSDFFFFKFQLIFDKPIQEIINGQSFWGMEGTTNIWRDYWERHNFLPIAFHVRDAIRSTIADRYRRHEIFGERERGSKVFVSHGYKIDASTVEIRIFGYSLKDYEINSLRGALKQKLPAYLFDYNIPFKVSVKEIGPKFGWQLL